MRSPTRKKEDRTTFRLGSASDHGALWMSRTPQQRQQWKGISKSNGLTDKLIEYNIETRRNSTYRMIQDAFQARVQIKKWVEHQNWQIRHADPLDLWAKWGS
jgi:hypothetical protein